MRESSIVTLLCGMSVFARKGGKERLAAVACGCALFAGCAAQPPKPEASYAPPPPQLPAPRTSEGSIFPAGRELALFEDQRAHRVGDVLTVVLVEKTQASKKSSTSTSKNDEVDIANPTILGAPLSFSLPNGRRGSAETNLQSSQKFSGEGDSSQSNRLEGRVTVSVVEVLPNGNMRIRGEKWLTINQGDEYLRLSGIVRPSDVTPDNAVLSTQVADAHISYAGTGTLADANSMGWMARFFNGKWWPF